MARKYTKRVDSAKKIEAINKHLVKQIHVSVICEELGIQPSLFYTWQKELFERGHTLFDNKPGPKKQDRSSEIIKGLESRLKSKDSVMVELLEEHMALKKSLGEI